MSVKTVLVSPYTLNLGGESALGGADSPPKSRGGMSETPCFTAFFGGRPLNLGGESSPRKFGGMGLRGLSCSCLKMAVTSKEMLCSVNGLLIAKKRFRLKSCWMGHLTPRTLPY